MTMPGDWAIMSSSMSPARRSARRCRRRAGAPTGWRFYFRTPDIDATAAKVTANGGTIVMGAHEVPGGDRIIVATDPHGVEFGAVGPGNR